MSEPLGAFPVLTPLEPEGARTRLERFVQRLVSARYRQLLADGLWRGLFWGTVAFTAAVLGRRLGWWPTLGWSTLAGLAALVPLASLARAWASRPSALRVAIAADVSLHLQQKLSTAWEVASRGEDEVLAGRLAAQVMRERLPLRPQRLFPLQLNTWGRFLPAAAALLALVAVTDLERPTPPAGGPVAAVQRDTAVRAEGARLLEYARDMQARAAHGGLPRAGAQATSMYHLAEGMERGAFDRDAALGELARLGTVLAQERDAARADARASELAPGGTSPAAPPAQARSTLQALAPRELRLALNEGRLEQRELARLAAGGAGLARLGVSQSRLSGALERYREGDTAPLAELLESLGRIGRLLDESTELGRAEARVQRAQRNLGAPDAGTGAASGGDSAPTPEPGAAEDATAGDGLSSENDLAGMDVESGAGGGTSRPRSRQQRELLAPATTTVRPQDQGSSGVVLAVPTRVLPSPGPVRTPAVEIDRKFERQMEAVLAREDYPLHRKELVRRYFLALSAGAAPAPAQAAEGTDR